MTNDSEPMMGETEAPHQHTDDGVEYRGDSSPNYSIPVAIVVAGMIIGLAIFMSGNGGAPVAGTAGNTPTQGHVAQADVDDDAMLGDRDAPVTIIEFSDYQCPFCRQFWSETLPLIKSEYIATGDVRFVYRDFPLDSIHPMARPTAEAAECAGDQGLYWEAHDVIFEQQGRLGAATIRYDEDDLYSWLGTVSGLDVAAVRSCVAAETHAAEVEGDLRDGRVAGITGTPGFVVNGRAISGALPFSDFQQVIEAALAEQRQ